MRADPAAQRRLLALQDLDSRADQLRHRRGSLAELAAITELERTRRTWHDRQRDAQILVDDLTLEQEKADADVEQVKARRTRDRDRIDQGLITNPKDLERMQHELVSLERRIGVLEDAEIEIMEKLEGAQGALDAAATEVARADEQLLDLGAARDRQQGEIDTALAETESAREPALAEIPEELLALYERLRTSKGGVGAALLRARQCGGCQLGLDAAEISTIRTADPELVVRCEECTRILVRTEESGL